MRNALKIFSAFFIGMISLQANNFAQAKKGLPMDIVLPEQIEIENRDQVYQLIMNDSWGDGWNGASLDLYVNNVLVFDDVTVDAATNSIDLDVDNHNYIHTEWTSGSYDYECSYGLYDPNGVLVAEAGTLEQPSYTLTYTIDFSGENIFSNSGFEGADPLDLGRPAEWNLYPNYNWSLETTGNGIYNSSETFVAYDGDKSIKMWNTGGENNIFKEMAGDDVPAVGTTYNMSAMLYSHADDFVQGGNHGKITAKYFAYGPNGETDGWWNRMIDMDPNTDGVQFVESEHLDVNSTPSTWIEFTLSTSVPENVFLMQLGVMLAGNEDGSIYVDNVTATMDEPAEGCTDVLACNHDMDAVLDDGSCCLSNCGDLTVGGGSYIGETSWEILDASGAIVMASANAAGTTGGLPYDDETCLEDGVYTFNGYDSYGDGWNGNYATLIDSEGITGLNFTFTSGSSGTTTFEVPFVRENQLVLAAILDLDPGDIVNPDTTADASDNDASTFGSNDGKAIVVQAMSDIDDLSFYGLGSANNGGGTDGVEFTFPAIPLAAGELLWVARTPAAMLAYFGDEFTGTFVDETLDGVSSAANANGNDAVELFLDGVAVDVYGELEFEGGSTNYDFPWAFTDSWAVRSIGTTDNPITRTPSTTFNIADWELGAFDCTSQGTAATNATSDCPMPHLSEPAFPCDLTHVVAELFDSFGDGWNGNVLDIAEGLVSLTIDAGAYAEYDLCLPDGLHPVVCDGGSWQGEVSWNLVNALDNEVLLSGGAPYSGYVQVGPVVDVLGCTEPGALNYDELATLDDGSCYYNGDSCFVAITAVEGLNVSDGDTEWFQYTATSNGVMHVSSQNATGDADDDTYLSIHDGDCASLALLTDAYGNPALNDDCCDYFGPSTVVMNVVAGQTFTILWTNQPGYVVDAFDWTLTMDTEIAPPANLTAQPAIASAGLSWDAAFPPESVPGTMTSHRNYETQMELNHSYHNEKKIQLGNQDIQSSRNSYRIHPDYQAANNVSRDDHQLDVTFLCDYGTWQGEVSWTVDYAGADMTFGVDADDPASADDVLAVVGGGAPTELVVAAMDEGMYRLNAADSFGDGWNGNYFFAYSPVEGADTLTFIRWTLGSGSAGSQVFHIVEDLSDLTVSAFDYDAVDDEFNLTFANNGLQYAWTFGVSLAMNSADAGTCEEEDAFAFFPIGMMAPGETMTMELPNISQFIAEQLAYGYGDFEVVAMVDNGCTEFESDETNNTMMASFTLTDPYDGVTWNVYRGDADGANHVLVGTAGPGGARSYVDNVPEGGDLSWYVTQVNDGAEGGPSNVAYASLYGADDFPAPTELTVEGNDYDAMLEWMIPDLTGWEPPSVSQFSYIPTASTKPAHTPYSRVEQASASRQGGDTFEDATVIESLPYENTGTTVGYTHDYTFTADTSGLICSWQGDYWASSGAGLDVVYSLALADETSLVVSACQSTYDTSLGIYTMMDDGTGTMVPTLVAVNDDWCGDINGSPYASEINCQLPAGDYFIVVSGYGTGGSGDYVLTVQDAGQAPPIAGYGVYRDDMMVAAVPGQDTDSFADMDLEDPDNPGGSVTHTYKVTAYYGLQDVESLPSNEASVTLPVLNCYPPSGLVAQTSSNNVMLEWESVPGVGGYFGHFNGTLLNAVGAGVTPFECAALMGPDDLADYDGLAMTKIAFIPADPFTEFKVFIYDAVTGLPLDSTDAIDGATFPDDMLDQWHEVELPNPITIDATQPLMFGYRVIGTDNPDGSFPAGADTGPAVQGYGDLIKGFGNDWVSMAYAYGDGSGIFDYNWAIQGYATIGDGRSLSSMDPVEIPISVGSNSVLESRQMTNPISVSHPISRSLLGYHVYRDSRHLGNVGPTELMFTDDWVPWGEYHYHVTAEYDHGVEGACTESEPAIAEVSLMNTAPGQVMLQTPADGSIIEVTMDNMDDEVQFFWTQANDPDNDVVHYHAHMVGHSEGDTLVDMEAPVMANSNPSLEDGTEGWLIYPTDLTNFNLMTTGDGIGFSEFTFEAYDGDHAVELYGQYGETYPNWTPFYQGHSVEALGLMPGDNVAAEVHLMSHEGNWIGQGDNYAYLFIGFYDANFNWISSTLSPRMDHTMEPSQWTKYFALAQVPEGAVNMNVGVEYWQETGEDHGGVYFDNLNVFVPVTQSIIRVSHEDLVMAAMQDSVHHVTVDWNVGAMDVWDMTPSSNGPFQFTLDLSATLGIDESTLPDVFALHNNYPNPFNPVTNITYDIPEVANVSLEIYNVMGQKVRTLASGSHEPGRYRVLWNATNDFGEGLSSGMYIYKIQAGDFVSVKKLILMK